MKKFIERLKQLNEICLKTGKRDRNLLKIEKLIIQLLDEALVIKADKPASLAKIEKAKALMDSIEFEYNDRYTEEALIGTLLNEGHFDKTMVSEICSQLSVISNQSNYFTIIKKLIESDSEINVANVLEEMKAEKNSDSIEYFLKEDYLKKAESVEFIECFYEITVKKYVQRELIEIIRDMKELFLNQIIDRLNLIIDKYIKVQKEKKYLKEIEETTSKLKEIWYHFNSILGDERVLINYMTDKGKALFCQLEMNTALKFLAMDYDIGEQARKYMKNSWKLISEIGKKQIIQPEGVYLIVNDNGCSTFIIYFGTEDEELDGIVMRD